jgi:hypothetical protein
VSVRELGITALSVLTAPRALAALAFLVAVLGLAALVVYSIVDTWAT